MKKHRGYESQDGSITVFLSLILLIILSLIMTVIEGARQTTAIVIAERALTTSMDSVLAEFYGPLMKEYNILGLDASYGADVRQKEEISQKMQEYMSYTLDPSQGLSKGGKSSNLHGLSIESVYMTDDTSLVDYQGNILIHEITEYMKYRSIGDVAEFLLDKASILEQPKKVSVLYEEKATLEGRLVGIDEGILTLMNYIDGISTGRKGLIKKGNGALKTESSFTKKILYGSPTMEKVGINNNVVFLALKDQYIDPSNRFSEINSSFESLERIFRYIGALETSLKMVQESREKERKALQQLEELLSNSKDEEKNYIDSIKIRIKEKKAKINELNDMASSIRVSIENYKKEQYVFINAIRSYGSQISLLVSGCLNASQQAVLELERIIVAAKEAEPLILAYEKNLNKEKSELSQEIYDNLEEGLEELKRYQIGNSYGYDFIRMKEILIRNSELLASCQSSLSSAYNAITVQNYLKAQNDFSEAKRNLSAYDTKGLTIDYSSLVLEDKPLPNYLDTIKNLIEEGVTGLVIDPDAISQDEILAQMLPSIIYAMSEDKGGFSFSGLIKNMSIGGKNSDMGGLFGSYGDYSLGSLVGNAADLVLKKVLVQRYIEDHFHNFSVNNNEGEDRKPSVLVYEWEYLLFGNASDKDNLEAAIGRLILIRTLLNFTSLMGDKVKWAEAKTIATSMVGFTGLPILVAITQGILMILLALASGLVDTCALLIGKEISIIKKSIDLNYSDLLTLSRDNIQRKANLYKEEKGFSYTDYLTLFLYLTNQEKLSYRMMDLMQENINMRYDADFNFQNCIFGYEAEAVFVIKPLFTNLSFIQKYINKDINKVLKVKAEYSY